jgi:hypothetical protein
MTIRFLAILIISLALTVMPLSAEGPRTLENNDSCDIALTPAATLLLPYFEVDLEHGFGETTLFTITNTTSIEQIARVTLWTDLAYPVMTFNIYLTGYDVQSISLYDVLVRGLIGPPHGTGTSVSHSGNLSGSNPGLDVSHCGVIPPRLDAAAVVRMQSAFTVGSIAGCSKVGGIHENAVGYATIDVVGNCGTSGPTDPEYFAEDIRYDNVLIGDYQMVNSDQDFAQGNPMVHIRAVPEGSTPPIRAGLMQYKTPFERTFYGRFQDPAHPDADARQPLPSTFAARWINGGSGAFETSFQIWRQGVTTRSANCAAYEMNGWILVAEAVVFDEHENGEGRLPEGCDADPCVGPGPMILPSTASVNIEPGSDILLQSILSTTIGGWVYLNLDDDGSIAGAHQNWVTVSMRAERRHSVSFDAAWLGNGCSPPMPVTSYTDQRWPSPGTATTPTPPGAVLPGPAADVNPREP